MNNGTILKYEMLTEHILELKIKINNSLPYQPGQWVLINFKDNQGEFKRAYSIVDYVNNGDSCEITLAIKILDQGRGSEIFDELKEGDNLDIGGIFGGFILKENNFPKVFIGTGTGLAAVLNMAKTTKAKQKILIFSVSRKSELFYEDRIKAIDGLDSKIHITRENIAGYETGRFDLGKENFDPASEFYICGNPEMVQSTIEKLKNLGFEKIYSEQY